MGDSSYFPDQVDFRWPSITERGRNRDRWQITSFTMESGAEYRRISLYHHASGMEHFVEGVVPGGMTRRQLAENLICNRRTLRAIAKHHGCQES